MGEQSARRCRGITDHRDTPVSASGIPCSRCSSSRTCSFTTDEALVDAQMVLLALLSHSSMLTPSRTKAIDAQPSMVAYIAKILAHVGKGEKDKASLECDIAFEHCHSSQILLPLPIKVCTLHLVSGQLPICFRVSSCSWPENTTMQYPTWIASLL